MNLTDIAKSRLLSQKIAQSGPGSVKELVGWMGAMQAQDFAMSKWAVGVRLTGSTEQAVDAALNTGQVVRTHVMRPTWHLVSADDIYWILALTAAQIKALARSRLRDLGLSEAVLMKSNDTIEKALSGGKHLTREALVAELARVGIATDENRSSHLLMQAELDGIVCSGARLAGKQTYALLEEWVPKPAALSREEALASLAKRYFASHCPATVQDFAWWSGLNLGDARRALEMVKADFISESIDEKTYWLPRTFSPPASGPQSVYLLPAYDEFLISYADRSASLPQVHTPRAVSSNGIFNPVVVVDGQVIGLWKRTFKKAGVIFKIDYFKQPDAATQNLIEKAALQFGKFLGKETEIQQPA